MREFEEYNPITVTIYYMSLVCISMFTMNPILHILSFTAGLIHFSMSKAEHKMSAHIFFILIGLILSIIRPIFSHNGATVLFVVNDNPITKEAFIYGINSAVMVVGVLYLFRVFSTVMTSDRLLYLFGSLSPKMALVLSMGLRYMPMLRNQRRITANAQTALGINKDDNAIDRIKARMNVFSATLSWGLENGIITADSMAARGYGEKKRIRFTLFTFSKQDFIIISLTIIFTGFILAMLGKGAFDTTFYPLFKMAEPDIFAILGYTAYGILLMIPVIYKIVGNIRWKLLMSEI
ncbi:MAG: cobalt transport protein [Lachnospiraceae bacterium]|nr:cobalt transport protein [Lachnospiraceae bacterium]